MSVIVDEATLLTKNQYLENLDLIGVRKPWFWLKDASKEASGLVAAVYYGAIVDFYDVDYVFSVIPCLILNDSTLPLGTKITYAGEIFTVLRNRIAFCDKAIAKMPFNRDYLALKPNDYLSSDVKLWIDKWFDLNGNTAATNN